jgi:hypothetical protein
MDEHLLKFVEAQVAAKEEWRRAQATNLTFPEKIRIVVELQKRRAPIMAQRGITTRVWRLDDDTPSSNPKGDE